jgi:uncharacterized protein (TIGR01777 family)
MRVLITGGTGFIGRRLLERLTGQGDEAVVLSRSPERMGTLPGDSAVVAWDPLREPAPAAAFAGVEAVFHLAGASVAGRWTRAHKERIRASRVEGTRNLVATLTTLATRPKVLVSVSAVGWYGARGDEVLTEEAPAADTFLAGVCRDWEAEARRAEASGIRVVNPRIGLVLGPGGGALEKVLPLFRLGLGGRLGDGRQWWPWIHVEDVVGILLHAAATPDLKGPVNAVAPRPATNRVFTRALGRVLHRPALFAVPVPLLQLGLGEFAGVLLASQRVDAGRVTASGYRFRYPELVAALHAVVDDAADTSPPGRNPPVAAS